MFKVEKTVSENKWDFKLGSLVLEIGFNDNNELCAGLYDEKMSTPELNDFNNDNNDIYYEWQPLKTEPTPINTGDSHLTDIIGSLYLDKSAVLRGHITNKDSLIDSLIKYSIILKITPNNPCPDIHTGINIMTDIIGINFCALPAETSLVMYVTPSEKVVLKGNENLNTAKNELFETKFIFENEIVSNENNSKNRKSPTYIVDHDQPRQHIGPVGTEEIFEGEVFVLPDSFSGEIGGTFTDKQKNTGEFDLNIYWNKFEDDNQMLPT